jgi:hypothetical protein
MYRTASGKPWPPRWADEFGSSGLWAHEKWPNLLKGQEIVRKYYFFEFLSAV